MGLPKTAPGPKYDPIQLQKEIQRLQTEDRGIEDLLKSLGNELTKLKRDELAIRAAIWKHESEKNAEKNPSENMNENLNA